MLLTPYANRKPPAGLALNTGHPLSLGIAGCWLFQQGRLGYDLASGTGNTLFTGTAPTQVMGPDGACLRFADAGGYPRAEGGSRQYHRTSSRWTLLVRLRVASYGGAANANIRNIWSNESNGNVGLSHVFRIGSRGQVGLQARFGVNINNGINNDNESGTDLALNRWYTIGVTCDGTNVTYYYDGAVESTAAYAITPQASTNAWIIGGYWSGSSASRIFDGDISFLYWWPGRCLNRAEVYNLSLAPYQIFGPTRRPATFYADAVSGVTASLSATLGAVTLSGAATVVAPVASNANLTQSLDAVTLSGSATAAAPGASNATLSQSIASVSLSGAATSAAPGSSTGSLSATLDAVTLTGSATAGAAGAVTGTLSANLDAITVSGAATSAAPGNTTATLSASLDAVTLSSVVTITVAGTVATLSATLDAVAMSGAATHVGPSGSTASLSATIGDVTLVSVVITALLTGPTRFASTARVDLVDARSSTALRDPVDPRSSSAEPD